MEQWIEVTGKTEEAAIQAALEQLGMDRDAVSVEVVDRAKSGFLGLGGNQAKVRVTYTIEEKTTRDRIEKFLSGLLLRMDSEASPEIAGSDEDGYQVELVGGQLGRLIGRRGETLDAIQQITSYAINFGQSKRIRVHVDAEGYRQKREESLAHLAEKVAGKVAKYRKNVTLEPMNAYERHVIHAALQDWENIVTYSQGTEPNRRIVVAFSKGGPHVPFA